MPYHIGKMLKLEWMDAGACNGEEPNLFFPEKGEMGKVRKAKLVCKECPVQKQCLRYALKDRDIVGIWGGTTDRERQTMRPYFLATLAS